MIEQNDIYEKMLLDYYSGVLPAAQRKCVEEWIEQSEENRKIARDIQYIFRATDALQTMREVNSDDALARVKSKMKKTKGRHSFGAVFKDVNDRQESLLINPNEEVTYNVRSREMQKQNTHVQTYTAWKDGLVVFKDTSFEEALRILSKRFNTEFIVKNMHLYDHSYTGTFDAQHLDLILEAFRISTDLQYKFISPETGVDKIAQKTIVELY